MSINIDNIVKANFTIEKTASSIGSYSKVIFAEKTDDTSVSKLADAKAVYKLCGGNESDVEELVIGDFNAGTDGGVVSAVEKIIEKKQQYAGTDNDFIFVCLSSNFTSTQVAQIAQAFNAINAPNRMCLCTSLAYTSGTSITSDLSELSEYPVAIKLYPTSSEHTEVCMAIPAYYGQMNLSRASELKDYAFTVESKELSKELTENDIKNGVKPWISQSDYIELVKNTNFVEKIGNSWVNFGGNLANGVSITGYFGTIALENDIIYAVLRGMLKKQYLTDVGLNNIVALINQAIARYTLNGFVEQNAVWSGSDYVQQYGKYKKQVMSTGQKLPEGYFVSKVPMSYLTQEDRSKRQFTPIKVFVQSQTGARIVDIVGIVID